MWRWNGSIWTWISGNNTGNMVGEYGIKGSSSIHNYPGSRSSLISWQTSDRNVWIFGGVGYASNEDIG